MFFIIIFSIYALINAYVFVRGWQAMPPGWTWRLLYVVVFLVFSSAFILGRIAEHAWWSVASEALVWVGAFWLAAMLYFVLIAAAADVARAINHFVRFFPEAVTADYARTKTVVFVASVAAVGLIVAGGHINTRFIRTRMLDIDVPGEVSGPGTLTIVMASDIHLGTIVGKSRLRQIVDRVNALEGDLVVLGGDIVDEDLTSVVKQQSVGDALKDIRAPLGVIAITGNHEYIGGIAPAVKFLSDNNVRLLRDETITIRDDIHVVGREDVSAGRHGGARRKPLEELLAGVDKRHPVIVLDHQPVALAETAKEGADVLLCGHTHNGQLWPWNLLVHAFYDVRYGYRRIGDTHVYVSSGAGTWGPPVRVGTHPEIVKITLHFK